MSYKRWVILTITLFVTGIAIGLAHPGSITDLLAEDLVTLEEQLGYILGLPNFLMAIFFFIKNAFAILISFALSPILCLVPILALTINGLFLGFVSSVVISEKSVGFLLVGLLPHGVFEIPALVIGEAAALSFGTMAMIALFKKERRQLLLPNLKQNLRYLLVALALLLPAAIIEAYITPLLLTQ
jgi:stage II sporulation protein M